MTSFEVILPVEAVPKGRPRFGGGHVYTPEKTSQFEMAVRFLLRKAVARQGLVIPALAGRIGLDATIWVREERSDGDNYLKAIMDAGNQILYKDDRQVKDFHVQLIKVTDGVMPHIDLKLWELE